MPWCEPCEKSWTPTALNADGTCPTCGRPVDGGGHVADAEKRKAPWHFWLMVAVISVYLTYRLIQLVLWVL